jgi:hypothetical protein
MQTPFLNLLIWSSFSPYIANNSSILLSARTSVSCMFIDNALVSPWVLIVWSIWLISNLFPYEFDFIKHLLKSNTCPVVYHRLSLV